MSPRPRTDGYTIQSFPRVSGDEPYIRATSRDNE